MVDVNTIIYKRVDAGESIYYKVTNLLAYYISKLIPKLLRGPWSYLLLLLLVALHGTFNSIISKLLKL